MNIDDWRRQIDEIDQQILRLLAQRAEIANQILNLKKASGLPIEDPERENEILEKLTNNNLGPLDCDSIKRIFSQIISEIKRLQRSSKE